MAVALVVACLAPTAAAQLDGDRYNAATWYRRAVERMPDYSNEDWDTLWAFVGPQTPPSRDARRLLAGAQPALSDLTRGSRLERCDFDLDFAEGPGLLLPHLAQLRSLSKLVAMDARVAIADRDGRRVSERIEVLYRVAGHMSQDGILISSLVGNAIYALGDRVTQDAFDSAVFDADHARRLAGGLRTLGGTDPFGMSTAVRNEAILVGDWIENRLADQSIDEIMSDFMWSEDSEVASAFDGMTDDEVREDLALYDANLNAAADAMADDDRVAAVEKLGELDRQLEAGETGLVAKFLIPAFGKAFERSLQTEVMIADRLAQLEKLQNGVVRPTEFANAAVLYLRAARAVEALDAPIHAFLVQPPDAAPVDPETPVDPVATPDEVRAALDAALADAVIAAGLERCVFPVTRTPWPRRFVPEHALALAGLFRALDARADLGVDVADTARWLGVGLEFARDLGTDDRVLHVAMAHGAFVDTGAKAAALVDTTEVPVDAVRGWRSTLTRFADGAPFNYEKALEGLRKDLNGDLNVARNAGVSDPADNVNLWPVVQKWSDDQVAYVAWVAELMSDTPSPPDALAAVPAVDPAALAKAIEEGPAVATLVTPGEVDHLFHLMDAPSLLDLAARKRSARADVRDVWVAIGRVLPEEERSAPWPPRESVAPEADDAAKARTHLPPKAKPVPTSQPGG